MKRLKARTSPELPAGLSLKCQAEAVLHMNDIKIRERGLSKNFYMVEQRKTPRTCFLNLTGNFKKEAKDGNPLQYLLPVLGPFETT